MPGLARGEVPWLPDEHIARTAAALLASHGKGDSLPIPVEEVAEFDCGMEIIPHPGLRDIDVESFMAWPARRIWVDQHVLEHGLARYRFILAHELGHAALHEGVYAAHSIDGVGSLVRFWDDSDPNALSRLEIQADMFAGLLLVPPAHLRAQFSKHVEEVRPMIDEARSLGRGRDEYLGYAVGAVIERLRPVFLVSRGCLDRRIKKAGLAGLIG